MRRLLVLAVALLVAGSAEASSVLDKIKSSGVIRLGYRADAEPYSYQTTDRRPAGYIVDVCKEIAGRIGASVRAEFVLVPANQRFEAVRDGRVDLLCDPSSATIARREIVDFSLPVFLDGAGVLSRVNDPIQRFEDISGKRVGVLTGTTTERVLRDALAGVGVSATIVPVNDHRDGMEMVWSGQLDAYFADRSILAARLRKGDRPGFELSKQYFSYETYALALPRDNSAFRLQVDRILAQLYRSGRINAIVHKTFGDAPLDDMVKAMFVINALPRKVNRGVKKSKRKTAAARTQSTGEAAVAALIAHGLDTIYGLPGVHNDDFFDALHGASDKLRVVHTRHEQGAAYMALGAALATGKPQAYSVVPGPGLLNSGAALLTAYSMNAPVLALIGQIPQHTIGRGLGQLHEIRDQAGIISRLVDSYAHIKGPGEAGPLIAKAFRAMASGRRGPAALSCAINIWGQRGDVAPAVPLPLREMPVNDDALRKAAKILGKAQRVLIVCGGGAQDASSEVTELSAMLQAPVLGYRRGRGVLDSRSPFSVTLPLGRELWAEADAVLAVGTRLLNPLAVWGTDKNLKIVRVDSDSDEPKRQHKPDAALVGEAATVLRKLIGALPKHNMRRHSRRDEMQERQAKWRKRLEKLAPQLGYLEAIRAELPEDGIYVDEVTQIGFVARLAFPVYKPRTFLSPGFQDNLGWGYATALGVQHAWPDVPAISINGDGGFLYTSNEIATAIRHRIPLVAIVFADGAFGNVRRIQQERYGNRVIASDLTNPDFVKYAESFGAAAERARNPDELRGALKRAFARREPCLIEVPVGPLPSPWEFIHMPRIRGA